MVCTLKSNEEDRLTCIKIRESGLVDCNYCATADQVYKVFPVEITGFAPILGGWRFVATLHSMPSEDGSHSSMIIRAVPGIDANLIQFRTSKIMCEHCYTDRVRKESFVVQNVETGELKQVGRTCLRDFLGHSDPHQLAEWGERLGAFDMSASGLGGCGISPYYNLKDYLNWVCGQVRREGWMSTTKAREFGDISTADEAWRVWHSKSRVRDTDFWGPNEWDIEEATKIHEWAQSLLDLPLEACNDYIHNLRVIISADAVESKTKGLAASLWIVYKKHIEREAAKQTQAQVIPSEWFGKVGDKVVLRLHCTSIIPLESAFGVSLLHKFIDASSRIFVWIQSAGSATRIDEGTTVVITGTIKMHKTWNSKMGDVKETVLTRCKLIEVV